MSESESKSPKDFNAVITEVMKFTRKVNTLGKAVDYVVVDLMPKIFRDQIEKAYEISKKQLDFFMGHVL
jgi:hypothetical protein